MKVFYKASLMIALLCIYGIVQTAYASIYFEDSLMDNYSVPDSEEGKTWYVDGKNGNDSSNGLTPETAFKSIGRALNKYKDLSCGDTIKIFAGKYYERLTIDKKFECGPNNSITIGPYGNGRVIIDGTNTNKIIWETENENIIKFNYTNLGVGAQEDKPQAIIMDNDFRKFRPVQNIAEVNSYGKWYWDKITNYVYLYTGGKNPLNQDVIVIPYDVNSVQFVVKGALGASGIKLMGLTIQGGTGHNVWIQGDYWKIEQCIIRYSLKGGSYGKGQNADGIGFKNLELSKNHYYGNVLLNWPRGTTWYHSGGWPPSITLGNYSYCHGNIVHDGGGEGIIIGQREGHDLIEDNIVYDNWSVGIYCGSSPGHIVRRNIIYVNRYDLSDIMDISLIPSWSSVNQLAKRLRQEGTTIGEEYAATLTSRADGTKIYNNLIINCRYGFNYIGERGTLGDEKMLNHVFANNVVILPDQYNPDYDVSYGFNLRYWDGKNSNNVIKNNIFYSTNKDVDILKWENPTDSGIQVDNNLYYVPNNSQPFLINPSGKSIYDNVDWSTYRAYGADKNSINDDPKFIAVGSKYLPAYYRLRDDSPAKNNAFKLSGFYNNDFFNLLRDTAWDIGAIEYYHGYNTEDFKPSILNVQTR